MAITVNDLINNLLPRLHAGSTSTMVHWAKTELIAWGDESLKRLGRVSGSFVARSTSITLVASQAAYSLPSRHVSTIRATAAGLPLLASSTDELEMLDSAYLTTTGDAPTHWYQDKGGFGKISVYPVPNATAALLTFGLLYNEWPAEVDTAEVNTTIPTPSPVADYIQTRVHAESVGKESDGTIPEVAAHLQDKCKFYEQIFESYWGGVQ